MKVFHWLKAFTDALFEIASKVQDSKYVGMAIGHLEKAAQFFYSQDKADTVVEALN